MQVMDARVDGNGRSQTERARSGFVVRDLEVGDPWGRDDGDVRELRLERRDSLLGGGAAIPPVLFAGQRRRGSKLRPGGRDLPFLLVAEREVEQRPGRGLEGIARGELGAGLGDVSHGHEPPTLAEHRLRCRGNGPGRSPQQASWRPRSRSQVQDALCSAPSQLALYRSHAPIEARRLLAIAMPVARRNGAAFDGRRLSEDRADRQRCRAN